MRDADFFAWPLSDRLRTGVSRRCLSADPLARKVLQRSDGGGEVMDSSWLLRSGKL